MSPRVVRVRDLPDQLSSAPSVLLHCRVCLEDFSAHRGDYFAARPDTILTCCDAPLMLARRRTVYEEA